MKYLKVFETTSEQQSYLNGDMITPSITITRNNESTINYIQEEVKPIKFYVNGNEHTADNWMTWEDLIDSEYNIYYEYPSKIWQFEKHMLFNDEVMKYYVISDDCDYPINELTPEFYYVKPTDKIKENGQYYAD